MHQNEDEGRHLGNAKGTSDMQEKRGKTRRNQKTGLSYRRPTRDYSKCIKWTQAMNKEIYGMYIRSKPEEKGYQGRLKAIWDHNKKDFKHFTGKHLAEQIRNIKKKNLLSEVDRQLIELQHRITSQEPATPTVTISQEETEQETNNHQEEVEDRREDESTNNIELKEELTKIWRKNFEKYIKMDINQREFSAKIKPPPNQEMLDILDLIVSEEIVTIEKSHPIDLWTINVIHDAD